MSKSRPTYPSRAKLYEKASRIRNNFLGDPLFQEALQKIRTEFHIPYPATPEDKASWYTHYFGDVRESALERAIDDAGPEFWHFVQEVGKYQEALSTKYGIPLRITWSKRHPFDSAVTDALGFLGLPNSFRNFLIACLWGEQWVPIGPSHGLTESRVDGFSELTITINSYDSKTDVDDVLSQLHWWWKRASMAIKGRPRGGQDKQRLQQIILDADQDNKGRPKGQKMKRKELMEKLWHDTGTQRLHELSKARFNTIFYEILREHGLVKQYQQWE